VAVAFPTEVCRALNEPELCPLVSHRKKPREEPPERIVDGAVFAKEFARELRVCGFRVGASARTILVPTYLGHSTTFNDDSATVEWRAHLDVIIDGSPTGRCDVSRASTASRAEGLEAARVRLDADRRALVRELAKVLEEPCATSLVGP
jgi:hypothetical protein